MHNYRQAPRITPFILGLIMWSLIISSTAIGCKLGADVSDSMNCRCNVGWVTFN